jgi:hypothetical protein
VQDANADDVDGGGSHTHMPARHKKLKATVQGWLSDDDSRIGIRGGMITSVSTGTG